MSCASDELSNAMAEIFADIHTDADIPLMPILMIICDTECVKVQRLAFR